MHELDRRKSAIEHKEDLWEIFQGVSRLHRGERPASSFSRGPGKFHEVCGHDQTSSFGEGYGDHHHTSITRGRLPVYGPKFAPKYAGDGDEEGCQEECFERTSREGAVGPGYAPRDVGEGQRREPGTNQELFLGPPHDIGDAKGERSGKLTVGIHYD